MGFEERNGRRYYYRKRRVDGKVVSEYIGGGALAYLAEWQADVDRAQRDLDRLELEALGREQRRVDQAVDTYHKAVRKVTATVLRSIGYHQHKRQWRLKRKREAQMAEGEVKTITGNAEEDQYFALMRAAQGKAKGKAVEKLGDYARAHAHIFDDFVMLRNRTLDEVLKFCSNDEITQIHLRGEANALRRRLGSADATPLERLLIDDIVHCWLRLCTIEHIYSGNIIGKRGLSVASVLYLEKRLSLAQRRYHRAIESLARVRGLLVRAGVQINIAQQQVVVNGATKGEQAQHGAVA